MWFLYGFAHPNHNILSVSNAVESTENALIFCSLVYFVQVNIASSRAITSRGCMIQTYLMLDFLEHTHTSI